MLPILPCKILEHLCSTSNYPTCFFLFYFGEFKIFPPFLEQRKTGKGERREELWVVCMRKSDNRWRRKRRREREDKPSLSFPSSSSCIDTRRRRRRCLIQSFPWFCCLEEEEEKEEEERYPGLLSLVLLSYGEEEERLGEGTKENSWETPGRRGS